MHIPSSIKLSVALLAMLLTCNLHAQDKDSTTIDPNPIEHEREEADRSVLKQKNGVFKFGENNINLTDFHAIKLEKGWHKNLSFRKDVVALARIESRNEHEDTLWLKGAKNPGLKKSLNRYKTKKERNSYRYGPSYGRGMGSHCPPGQCFHYFLALTGKGEWIELRSEGELTKILPEVKNDWDAVFLTTADLYAFEPILASRSANGWQLLLNTRVRDCPITYADKLIGISKKGQVMELGSTTSRVTKLCY